MLNWKELIWDSSYRDKINCILPVMTNARIYEEKDLQNLPNIVGQFCGVDVYQFVAEMNTLIALNSALDEEEE
jgi:hypothetical protein